MSTKGEAAYEAADLCHICANPETWGQRCFECGKYFCGDCGCEEPGLCSSCNTKTERQEAAAINIRYSIAPHRDGVMFDREKHLYRDVGTRSAYPSVTQLLAEAGFDRWTEDIPDAVLERAGDRGSAVHAACHYVDEDDLDYGSLGDAVKPYLDQYLDWKAHTNFHTIAAEVPLIHRAKGFAGTFDRLGLIGATPALVDIKTGPLWPVVALQLMAYAELVDMPMGCRRFALRLTGKGRPEVREYSIQDAVTRDLVAWRAVLKLHDWKEGGKS